MPLSERPVNTEATPTVNQQETPVSDSPESASPTDTAPRLAYTARETAETLGIPHSTVLSLIREGRLRATRYSAQRYVVPADAIAEFLAARPA